jgi:thiosulfate/3-mercaptopyruvate sulfurtransferase
MNNPLVTPEALQAHLGDPDLFVLDLRRPADYEAGHIPGSVNGDYEAGGWRVRADGGLGLLPAPDHLSALLGQLGLAPEHRVVIVTAGANPSDIAGAARVYWTLKIVRHSTLAVLDGGFRAWAEDPSRPVATGREGKAPGSYPVTFDEALRSDLEASLKALERRAVFVDARSAAHYEGREKAGGVMAAGHIPGALSYDYAGNVDPASMRLLPKERLAQRFAALKDGPVVSYCNTGHTAALNWFVLSEILGRPNVRLFDGSMSQWSQDPQRPVKAGPERGEGQAPHKA